jgi:hypothetical protein
VSYLHSSDIYTAVQVTAVTLILRCMSQRCHWHCCTVCSRDRFSNKKKQCFESFAKIFHKVGCTVVSIKPLWYAQRCHCHCCDMHSGIVDTAVTCIAVSLPPPWYAQRCHWHRCGIHSGVNYTSVHIGVIFEKAYQGPKGSILMTKKQKVGKSRVRVPFQSLHCMSRKRKAGIF